MQDSRPSDISVRVKALYCSLYVFDVSIYEFYVVIIINK